MKRPLTQQLWIYVLAGTVIFFTAYIRTNIVLSEYMWGQERAAWLARFLSCAVVLPTLLAISSPRERWRVTLQATVFGLICVCLATTQFLLYYWRFDLSNLLMIPAAGLIGLCFDRLFERWQKTEAAYDANRTH